MPNKYGVSFTVSVWQYCTTRSALTETSNKVIYRIRYFISVLYIIAFQYSDKLCNVVSFHLSVVIAF